MILDLNIIGKLNITTRSQNLLIISLESMREELKDVLKDKIDNPGIIYYNEKLEEIEDLISKLSSMK
tara:strand:- start:870 stop:1070 length:201 start_codon:yes stop_codon:yes gene_type:complete